MYRWHFEIPDSESRPDDTDWTGAEIRSCCRLAALLDITLHQAAQNVVPVAVTAAESVDKLRTWAERPLLERRAAGRLRPGQRDDQAQPAHPAWAIKQLILGSPPF